ncbi:MAG: DUF1499 domain-containing protein [Gammaproteobacteria bacterium]
MRRILLALGVVASLALAASFALGWWSANGAAVDVGLVDGRLRPCGSAPNCVCSEAGAGPRAIEPLALPPAVAAWPAVVAVVGAAGGEVVTDSGDYLHARFTSRIFRYVDDVEIRRAGDRLHLRSASRVGYSDLGANRRRVDAIRAQLAARLDDATR